MIDGGDEDDEDDEDLACQLPLPEMHRARYPSLISSV